MTKTKSALEMYQVKITQKNNPKNVLFGTVQRFDEKADELWAENKIVVEQAVYGREYIVDLNEFKVEEQPFEWGKLDKETRMPIGTEYDKHVFKEYKKHLKRQEKAGEGIQKHKMFQVGVADGYAHYVITKVGKRNVEIEWRGFGADNYFDMTLGGGGSFPRHCIEPHCRWADARKKMFS